MSDSLFNDDPSNTDDVLGLDQTLKLTKRTKVARLDNERIMDKTSGISYVVANYSKVTRSLARNDRHFQKKYAGKTISRSAKFEHEYQNLASVLQFYQLWCHGLFPKAKFKDCIHLLRVLGAKSSQLKLYRRELIEIELEKLKIEKGFYGDHPRAEAEEGEVLAQPSHHQPNTNDSYEEDEEDDWSFMNRPRISKNNGLFIGDDEDHIYSTPIVSAAVVSSSGNEATAVAVTSSENTTSTAFVNNPDGNADEFSDDDDVFLEALKPPQGNTATPSIAETDDIPSEAEFDHQEDEDINEYDLELMREFS